MLISEVWEYRNNLIVHDAVDVALAKHLGAVLLTGDHRLAGAPNLPVQVVHISSVT